MLRVFPFLLIFLAAVVGASAAPISVKELDLMVRTRMPENEILRDVQNRRLLTPLDAAAVEQLRKNGASANLIQRLTTGNFTVRTDEAARFQQQQAASQAAASRAQLEDEAAVARNRGKFAALPADTMRKMFEGKLVRMENGSLRPYDAEDLRHIRYFALYYSAHWCGPCRKFTPQLVSFYRDFKVRHPEFEIIFISNDYSAQDMEEYMKKTDMPWPAVKHDQADAKLRSLAGSGIPWLGLYNDLGEPVSSNSKDKRWVDPGAVMNAFKQAAEQAQAAQ